MILARRSYVLFPLRDLVRVDEMLNARRLGLAGSCYNTVYEDMSTLYHFTSLYWLWTLVQATSGLVQVIVFRLAASPLIESTICPNFTSTLSSMPSTPHLEWCSRRSSFLTNTNYGTVAAIPVVLSEALGCLSIHVDSLPPSLCESATPSSVLGLWSFLKPSDSF
jgi:hypothetical protein